ncbi:hypothetical protein C0J52_25005 [Blattella germanica]|nr:hypothetical protein C0J52_25005 [Blattella germanica]
MGAKVQRRQESCDNKPRQSRPRSNRSDDMIKSVEKVVLEDCRMTVEHIASKVGFSTGSVLNPV